MTSFVGHDKFRDDVGSEKSTPIAIVGMSFQFPGDATDEESFWSMLMQGRCASDRFPEDRLNDAALYHPDPNRGDSIPLKGGHFINQNLGAFDAPFFSISAAEAVAMDPQSRSLLETTYRALENAGIPIESISNSNTSVYTGNLADDYKFYSAQDIERNSRYGMVGMTGLLSGRVSWFFNLKGSSVTVDTACSSSLVALDLGCQSLSTSSSNMSIVTGCSLLFAPNFFHLLSNMGMLSPDAKCYSFDHRANGYGRGEGIAAIILKRLPDAIRDGDSIRAVIRSTCSNQDGRTPGVTQPCAISQSNLIRQTYNRAGLNLHRTRYIEAHGTGTPVGDPIEVTAIGEVFESYHTKQDPLYIGSVKTNIGHTEGASGLASIVKSVLILESGVIPPNANFERLNPQIESMGLSIKVPSTITSWPERGLRRISVNSFGASGTNAHVILDDAHHFLQEHDLQGNHMTVPDPPLLKDLSVLTGTVPLTFPSTGSPSNEVPDDIPDKLLDFPRILVFSAFDKPALQRVMNSYSQWIKQGARRCTDLNSFMSNLSHTLIKRRSLFLHRCFAIIESSSSIRYLESHISPLIRAAGRPRMAFIFTGQGAQWTGMARELMRVPRFFRTVREADVCLKGLGCECSVIETIWGNSSSPSIDRPMMSQTLCTIIQIALVDLYASLKASPSAVVGHSSGEIAAAYCIGAISMSSAIKLAYFRGIVAEEVRKTATGGMLATGMSEIEANDLLKDMDSACPSLVVACINSPRSVTISGDLPHLGIIEKALAERNIFHRRLKVDVAYHSRALEQAAKDYTKYVGDLAPGAEVNSAIMVSSTTAKVVSKATLCKNDYWAQNLVQPVRFSDAITELCGVHDTGEHSTPNVSLLLEVGPHSTLQGPISDTLKGQPGNKPIAYYSTLTRNRPADQSFQTAMGSIWSHGLKVDLELANSINCISNNRPAVISSLPEYPFDHSNTYWQNGRLGKEFRFRRHARLDLLGKPVLDWNPLEPRWTNFLKVSELPWAVDHKINGAIIYPAVGMLVMAIEAANQMAEQSRPLAGIRLTDTHFSTALTIPTAPEGIETQLILRPLGGDMEKNSWSWEFRLHSCKDNKWQEHCCGKVHLDYEFSQAILLAETDREQRLVDARAAFKRVKETALCRKTKDEFYNMAFKSGYTFGPSFKAMDNIYFSGAGSFPQAIANVQPYEWKTADNRNHFQPHIVHPTTLDGILQVSLVAFSRGGLDIVSTAVPTEIQYLWISTSGLSYPAADAIKTRGTFINSGLIGYETSVTALDGSSGKIVLEARGIKLRYVTGASGAEQPRQLNTCYNVQWKPDVDFHGILSGSGGLDAVYAGTHDVRRYNALCELLDLQSFKTPQAHILHIDGGQDDDVTSILRHLFEDEPPVAKPFPCASFRSKRHCAWCKDITLEPEPKNPEMFNVVLISGSSDLKNTITEAFRLLNVGGKVIIVPTNESLTWKENLGGTSIPKSRVGQDQQCILPMRELNEPTTAIPQSGWALEEILGESGFCNPRRHNYGDSGVNALVTAVKCSPSIPPQTPYRKYVFIHGQSAYQEECASALQSRLETSTIQSEKCPLNSMAVRSKNEASILVFLCEAERPFLDHISQEDFDTLRDTLSSAQRVVWLTTKNDVGLRPPGSAMSDGLMRVLRSESQSAVIVTVCLEKGSAADQADKLLKVLAVTDFSSTDQPYESEYIENDGKICIGRVVASRAISEELSRKTLPYQSEVQEFVAAPPLQLAIETPGLLDSLHFVEDTIVTRVLAPNEVEIKVSHVGLNFKDLLLALGRENGKTFGNECAGIVSRAGSATSFKPGERVCAFSPTAFSTFTRVLDDSVARVPADIELAHAAGVPTQYVTAWHSLCNVAKLKKGETILIHSAAGGTGQVAVQIAQLLDAEIFATVGTEEKRRFLTESYGISEDHIYSSRNTAFAESLLRKTSGRGVDVVLNSLSGEGLLASWELIAPYGRFIEIGKKDILANSNLPMRPFMRRATFSAVETGIMSVDFAASGRDMIEHLLSMLVKGHLQMVKNFQVIPISKIEDAMRILQSGNNIGKIVIEMADNAVVPTRTKTRSNWTFAQDRTYVIAGGTSGLGLAIAEWMVKEKGARSLLLLSRSGANRDVATKVIHALRNTGVTVEAPECDICDIEVLKQVLERYKHMRPIAGCVQSSMVLRDGLFANMSHENWRASTDPKTIGSWNLHTCLPKGMEFFVMLSSLAGLIGSAGQSNYAAGNAYMDALAHYRTANGEMGVAFDLGAVADHGVLAENEALRTRLLANGFLKSVSSAEVFSLLDYYCNPHIIRPADPQIALGLALSSQIPAHGSDRNHPLLSLPLYRHVFNGSSTKQENGSGAGSGRIWREQFIDAPTMSKAATIASEALINRLMSVNPGLQDRVETNALDEPLQRFGVDSLVAIELRSWFAKEFAADVPVFEILGDRTLESIGIFVAEKSALRG